MSDPSRTASLRPLPRRPMLRPGIRVCRREDGLLQIGLTARLAVRAPDSAEIRAVLAGMRDGVELAPLNSLQSATARCCVDLLDHGLLVDADDLLSALGAAADPHGKECASHLVASGGTTSQWRERSKTLVEIRNRHLPHAADLLSTLLSASGIAVGTSKAPHPGLVVLLTNGVVDRSEVDVLVRRDQPHVFLTCVEGFVSIGPFVNPGASGCLRCIDAHHTERDPRWALVVEQYLTHAPPTVPDPVPHDLVTVAVGALARDVVRWVDGQQPATWSTTIEIDPDLALERTPWHRHPSCGCNWDELYAV